MENLHPFPLFRKSRMGKWRVLAFARLNINFGGMGFPVPVCSVQDCSLAFRSTAQFARIRFADPNHQLSIIDFSYEPFFSQNDGYRSSHRCSRYSFSRSGYHDHSSPSCESSYRGHWSHYGRWLVFVSSLDRYLLITSHWFLWVF